MRKRKRMKEQDSRRLWLTGIDLKTAVAAEGIKRFTIAFGSRTDERKRGVAGLHEGGLDLSENSTERWRH
ncbi:hypothetical protein V6N12_010152 [Hibiscus sabdariffa]|uniref:Uncharacterized protein n=1 Tax=Hibiscus sabdariffa TaxID=183260 RepID=A0ABR2ECV1_9ROSI